MCHVVQDSLLITLHSYDADAGGGWISNDAVKTQREKPLETLKYDWHMCSHAHSTTRYESTKIQVKAYKNYIRYAFWVVHQTTNIVMSHTHYIYALPLTLTATNFEEEKNETA